MCMGQVQTVTDKLPSQVWLEEIRALVSLFKGRLQFLYMAVSSGSFFTALSLAPPMAPISLGRPYQGRAPSTTYLPGSGGHINPSTKIRWRFTEGYAIDIKWINAGYINHSSILEINI